MNLPKLILDMNQRDPVYFFVHGYRYSLEGWCDDDFVSDELAAPNAFTLTDVESGEVVEFAGASAVTRLCQHPLAGGTTMEADEDTFDYVVYDSGLKDSIGLRVIVSSRFSEGFFDRLRAVCQRLGMRLLCETCVPYWKIEGLDEIGVTADRAPTLTLPEWRAVFEELFHHTDYIIEREPGGHYALSFKRYTTPEETERLDEENYFVIMCMTEACLKHQ